MKNISPYYPILAAIAAYLIGSLSFAVIVSKLMGLSDPRTFAAKIQAQPMSCVRVTNLRRF